MRARLATVVAASALALSGCGAEQSKEPMPSDISTQGSSNEASDQSPSKTETDWRREEKKDEMTDVKTVRYSTRSFPHLYIFCKDNDREINVYISYEGMLRDNVELNSTLEAVGGRLPYWDVKIRMDEGEPIDQKWRINTDYEFLYPDNSENFLKSLSGHEKLIILPRGRLNPDVLKVSGSEKIYEELSKFCGSSHD